MSGQVIFFSVVLGAAAMGVSCKVTVFSRDLLRFMHDHCLCTCRAVRRAGLDRAAPWGRPTLARMLLTMRGRMTACRRRKCPCLPAPMTSADRNRLAPFVQ